MAIQTIELLNYKELYIKRSVHEMILKIYNIFNKVKNKNSFSRSRKKIFSFLLIYKYILFISIKKQSKLNDNI